MAKFSKAAVRQSPIRTTTQSLTHEGGQGYSRDAKSELFVLAASNMVREPSFYESAYERDERFKALCVQVTKEDPEWMRAFIPYLRKRLWMRSGSVVALAHAIAAGLPRPRQLVSRTLSRADEPAELLAYYTQTYGKKLPQALKRGLADSINELYTERSALKWDSRGSAWRMGDLIELVHPKPLDERQSELFRFLIDRRHGRDNQEYPLLSRVGLWKKFTSQSLEEKQELINSQEGAKALRDAAVSWEALSGSKQGAMDAAAWQAMIPSMGYMALLRNLRNFEQAGVSEQSLKLVAEKLSDPIQVARSMQFPFRFYSAWRNLHSERFAFPLEQALELSLANIPSLKGRTLVLVDLSGSMQDRFSSRGTIERWEQAALFGVALAKRCQQADLVAYSNSSVLVKTDRPTLRTIEAMGSWPNAFGGTMTMQTLAQRFDNHDRVVIVSDEQMHPFGGTVPDVLIYGFNIAGYRVAHLPSGPNSHSFAGLNDAAFVLLDVLERNRDGSWEFVQSGSE